MWSLHRYPCVRSQDVSDCAVAALASVARFHGLDLSLPRLRELLGTDRQGTNLKGVVEAAERLGFQGGAFRGTLEALPKLSPPFIAHIASDEGLGHFVVVYKIRRNYLVVADPAKGLRRFSLEEFQQRWSGYVVVLVPDPQRFVARREDIGPWQRLGMLLWPHRRIVFEAFLAAVLLTLLGLSTSFYIQHLVDSVLVHGRARLLNALGIGMLAIVGFRTLFQVLRSYLLVHLSRKLDLTLMSDYMRHVLTLPISFFESRRTGDVLSRINDSVKIRDAVSGVSLAVVVDGVTVLCSTVVLFLYDWPLALTAYLFIPVLMVAVLGHHPFINRTARRAMEESAKFQSHLVEDATSVETIKAFRVERGRSNVGDHLLVRMIRSIVSLQFLGASTQAFALLITATAGIVVLWYGGHRVMAGYVTIGELLFFNSVLGYTLTPLQNLAQANLSIQSAVVAIDRLYEVMDLDAEETGSWSKIELAPPRSRIELRDVTFRYFCRADVLKRVDLEIPVGQTTAIVGESGSGKSTLLKLLLRLHDPNEGQILIDGVDTRDVTRKSLRGRIGLVSQDPTVFNGTISENIALARPDASTAEIVAAAESAQLHDFVQQLPARYDTLVGERGASLSGGQRQRLALARVLLMDPDIIILDEATSHLDTVTEGAIQRKLRERLDGKTLIVVAHRLSTVRYADRIVVLEDGRVIETGNHQELRRRDGVYASLWQAQNEEPEEVVSTALEPAAISR